MPSVSGRAGVATPAMMFKLPKMTKGTKEAPVFWPRYTTHGAATAPTPPACADNTPLDKHRASLLKTPTAAKTPNSAAQETLGATGYGSRFWEEEDDQEQHMKGLRIEL